MSNKFANVYLRSILFNQFLIILLRYCDIRFWFSSTNSGAASAMVSLISSDKSSLTYNSEISHWKYFKISYSDFQDHRSTSCYSWSYINCGFLCIYAVFKNVFVIIFIDKANPSLGSVSIVASIRTSICIKIGTVIIYNTYFDFPYFGLQFQGWYV